MKLTAEQENKKEYYQKNKEKILAQRKEYRAAGKRKYYKETERKQKLRSNYGLDWESYVSLYNKQQGLCAVCFKFLDINAQLKSSKPYVDHCHTTKKVRGLLCHKCNLGLGHFEDNINTLQNACNYLKQHEINK
jgi:Recombination endonuclease VII